MALTKDSQIRKKHGGLTSTGGGTGGSYAFLVHAENGASLSLDSIDPKTTLEIWATEPVAPEHQAARKELLDEIVATKRDNETFWEAADEIGGRRTLTAETWQTERHLIPRARAAAQLQMIAQANIEAEGGFIRDKECRANFVSSFLLDGPEAFNEKLREVLPVAASQYGEQLYNMVRVQPPSYIARQVMGAARSDYHGEFFAGITAPEPNSFLMQHLDDFIESGWEELPDETLKALYDEYDGPMGTVFINIAFRTRKENARLYQGVDTANIDVAHNDYNLWRGMRLNQMDHVEKLQEATQELEAMLPDENGVQPELSHVQALRWKGMDEARLRNRLEAVNSAKAAAQATLDRTTQTFPQKLGDDIALGSLAQIGLYQTVTVAKVNAKSIVDTEGVRHEKKKVWSII